MNFFGKLGKGEKKVTGSTQGIMDEKFRKYSFITPQCKKCFRKQSNNSSFSDLLGAVNISLVPEGFSNSIILLLDILKCFDHKLIVS